MRQLDYTLTRELMLARWDCVSIALFNPGLLFSIKHENHLSNNMEQSPLQNALTLLYENIAPWYGILDWYGKNYMTRGSEPRRWAEGKSERRTGIQDNECPRLLNMQME